MAQANRMVLSFSDLCQPAIHSRWELKQLAAVRFQAVCGSITFILRPKWNYFRMDHNLYSNSGQKLKRKRFIEPLFSCQVKERELSFCYLPDFL